MKCRNCGTGLPAGAMFCGECGVAVAAPPLVEPATKPRPGDTAIIQPLEIAPTEFIGDAIRPAARSTPKPGPRVRPTPVAPVTPVAPQAPQARDVAAPATTPAAAPTPSTVVAPAPVPGPEPVPAPASAAPAPSAPPISPISPPPLPAPPAPRLSMPTTPTPDNGSALTPAATSTSRPAAAGIPANRDDEAHDDVEATRLVASRHGDRFVLQFSTGENSTVYGSGLIGRNPVTQPGEYVDQIVTIVDPGKSVSKTHLEFGQTAGVFWVVDRYSANGTIVRQPDAPPQRLDPGKRQPVARGSRIDMGEQFVVVS